MKTFHDEAAGHTPQNLKISLILQHLLRVYVILCACVTGIVATLKLFVLTFGNAIVVPFDLTGLLCGEIFGWATLVIYGEVTRVVLGGTVNFTRMLLAIFTKCAISIASIQAGSITAIVWLFSAMSGYLLIFPAALISWKASERDDGPTGIKG